MKVTEAITGYSDVKKTGSGNFVNSENRIFVISSFIFITK
jgi:hypothetical protein